MVGYIKDTANLMELYSTPNSFTRQTFGRIRQGFLQNEYLRISRRLVDGARDELQRIRKVLDTFSSPIAQALFGHAFPDGEQRVLMLAEGTFIGEDIAPIDSVVPINLGANPHQLFKNPHGYLTIDDYLTREKTNEFIGENSKYLSEKGYTEFRAGKSRFFYFRLSDLEKFLRNDGTLDMSRLVPLIHPTIGYIVVDKVERPSFGRYEELVPPHMSQRLKDYSLVEKALKRLGLPHGALKMDTRTDNGYDIENIISDWVAFRICFNTRHEVYKLGRELKESDRTGSSNIEFLNWDDEIKDSGFWALTLILRVKRGRRECPIEVQIVDSGQYVINETTKQTLHTEHEKKRRQIPKEKRTAADSYRKVLEEIFVCDYPPIIIPIKPS